MNILSLLDCSKNLYQRGCWRKWMLPIYSERWDMLSNSQSRSCAMLHHHKVWHCFSWYYGIFNEIEGGSAFWQSWWESPRLSAPNLTQWLGSNFKNSLKELWASSSGICYAKISYGSHTQALFSSYSMWYYGHSSWALPAMVDLSTDVGSHVSSCGWLRD